jgi:predicted RNA-binding protein YlxR (DUF448 family)
MRTCTGCRTTAPQRELVRLAFDGPRLVLDRTSARTSARTAAPNSVPSSRVRDAMPSERMRRLPGRGAYVHAKVACVTVAGLSRSLRRQVSSVDVLRIVSEMSPTDDNLGAKLGDQPLRTASQNAPGLEGGDTVEMPPRIKAKDDRSEDARL